MLRPSPLDSRRLRVSRRTGAHLLGCTLLALALPQPLQPAAFSDPTGERHAESEIAREAAAERLIRPQPVHPGETVSREARILERLLQRGLRIDVDDLERLAHTIKGAAERNAMDPDLIVAVIEIESHGRSKAISKVGARGLMQVLPSTGAEVARKLDLPWRGPDALFDPHFNVVVGTAYLGGLQRRYGDLRKALAAYNWGPGRIDRFLRRGQSLPRRYVESVLRAYEANAGVAGRPLSRVPWASAPGRS